MKLHANGSTTESARGPSRLMSPALRKVAGLSTAVALLSGCQSFTDTVIQSDRLSAFATAGRLSPPKRMELQFVNPYALDNRLDCLTSYTIPFMEPSPNKPNPAGFIVRQTMDSSGNVLTINVVPTGDEALGIRSFTERIGGFAHPGPLYGADRNTALDLQTLGCTPDFQYAAIQEAEAHHD